MPGVLPQQFVPVPLEDFDHASPLEWRTFADLHKLQNHVRQTIYDPAIHTPIIAHDHDGVNSALVITPDTPNLVFDSHPTSEGRDSLNGWEKTGVSLEHGGLRWKKPGHTTIGLGDRVGTNGIRQWGTGGPVVLVVSIRSTTLLTAFDFRMGLTDGHTTTTAHEAAYGVESINTGFTRLYTFVADFNPSAFSETPRMMLRVVSMTPSSTVGVEVYASIIIAKPATIVPWYDVSHDNNRQHNWELIGTGDVPTYDMGMSFQHAVFAEST